jgi:hypothetical protein
VARYLVIHTPRAEEPAAPRPPSRLRELASSSTTTTVGTRWLRAWSPDLHDDRIFTLWEASNGDAVRAALEEFGFLDDMDALPLRVRDWGPEEVLAADG